MAKKAARTNKTAIIREILDSGVTSPKEVVVIVKEKHGLDIKPQYVSIVKSSGKKKGRKVGMKRKASGSSNGIAKVRFGGDGNGSGHGDGVNNGLVAENAALKLALAAGGVENAIRVLESLR